MKKPTPKRAHGRSARRVRQALLISTGLLAAPSLASAQAPGCTTTTGNCTIAAGSYSQPYSSQIFSSLSINLVNNGTFTVVTAPGASFNGAFQSIANGATGLDSTSGNAGSGSPAGNFTLQNNGAVTHSLNQLLSGTMVANAVYVTV